MKNDITFETIPYIDPLALSRAEESETLLFMPHDIREPIPKKNEVVIPYATTCSFPAHTDIIILSNILIPKNFNQSLDAVKQQLISSGRELSNGGLLCVENTYASICGAGEEPGFDIFQRQDDTLRLVLSDGNALSINSMFVEMYDSSIDELDISKTEPTILKDSQTTDLSL